jgi:hypothetical protein
MSKPKNKNLSDEIIKVNLRSSPALGSSVPASKDGRGNAETQTAKHEVVTVTTAKESGGVKEAIAAQCGRPETGPDNYPLENSGCSDCDDKK